MTIATIFGCAGPALGDDEAAFFREAQPWGFILFGRNIGNPDQVRRLVRDLRATVGRHDAPVLVDQEGGRVARLGAPHWRAYPPARAFARLAADDPTLACEMAWLGARLIAHDLHALGINVDCAPVLDVPAPGAHDIIGDRAYGDGPDLVALLGRVTAEGLMAGGVAPVIKHIPGHGRALADSHLELPAVEADITELEAMDFAPFRALADAPMAMTAHVVFRAIDPERPATVSPIVIGEVIRDRIGFSGLLMTDDLSMRALGGTFAERTVASLEAGCDVVLHCNGDPREMAEVAAAARPLAGESAVRASAALERVAAEPESFDQGSARRRFDAAFDMRFAA
ncbi:MAG TPA: beta-N-acetylhexosaminidase [Caulobacteraceae bacterium]